MTNKNQSRNSSITRVRPILGELFKSKEGGPDHLCSLLATTKPRGGLATSIRTDPGSILTDCRRKKIISEKGFPPIEAASAFEWVVPPPGEFLRWMLMNPGELAPPKTLGTSSNTDQLRQALLDPDHSNHSAVKSRALDSLSFHGACNSGMKWWAFEGFSFIDCLVETESFVLFIEGKRTEESSSSVSWYPNRNQIARNLECARQYALKGETAKQYAVLMVVEEGVNTEHHQNAVREESLRKSWPHYESSPEIQEELLNSFLGIITWQEIIEAWNLDKDFYTPDTVDIAIQRFLS